MNSHEIRPAIADIHIKQDKISIELKLNLEIFLADIDASVSANTDLAVNASQYDRVRALNPNILADIFKQNFNEFVGLVTIKTNTRPLILKLISLDVGGAPDLSLPRYSRLILSANLESGENEVRLGWDQKLGALIVRQIGAEGVSQEKLYTGYLKPGQISDPIHRLGSNLISVSKTVLDYIDLGITHIFPKGLDHILFILGLFFFSHKFSRLAWQITLFTIAHTVTLALASLELISVPSSIIEPLIALSICYVAIENILQKRIAFLRLVVIFIFGLLHGLGFASVLNEIGLSQTGFIASLIGFNIGVEIGQLGVIVIAYFAVGFWFGHRDCYRPFVQIPASITIAVIGGWWFLERIMPFI
ncbi:MAG: HupE/UreJ family protein [Rhodospirillales bacterium]